MCNVHAHARGVAAGAEQRGAMDEAELANAYSSLCALHDSGEISTQERDRQLSLLRASSIVPPPPPSGAVDALRQRTSAALALAREHAAPKVEVLRERTSSALASARERAAPKVEELRERTSAALASARERAAPQVEELRERTSSALASARQAVDARVFGARRSASAERVPGRPPPTTTLPAAAGPSRFQPFAEGARHGPAPAPPPRSTAEPQPLIDLDGAVTNDLPRVGPFIDLSDAGMARPGTTDDAGALLLSELMDAPLADAPPAPRAIAHAASESNADATLLAVLGTEPASTVSPGVAAGRRDRRPVCRSPTAEEESARKEALARLAQWRATGANAAVGASDCGMAWVEHAMLAGMAPRVQGELWAAAWADHAECESYESLVDEAEKVRARLDFDWDGSYRRVYARLCAELDVIAEDVPRTALEDGGAVDAAELEALLWAHAIAEGRDGGQMGYVQGMADIGAFLLARCRPHQAFGCMRALLARPLVRLLLSLDVDEWLLLSTAVNNLLGIHLPALFVRLGEWQLDPAMYLPEWLMTLWTRSLRPELTCHVWNLLAIEGDRALLRVTLAVCAAIEPALLGCADMASCRNAMSTAPMGITLEQLCTQLDRAVVTDAPLGALASMLAAPPPAACTARPPPQRPMGEDTGTATTSTTASPSAARSRARNDAS